MTNREMLELLCRDMGEVKVSVHRLEEDVASLKEDVTVLKEDVAGLKEDVTVLKEDVAVLKEDVTVLKEDVDSIKLTQENEIRKNILTISDGHIDLNRKLDEALKVEQEKEMTILRVTILENDMRIMKNQLGITA